MNVIISDGDECDESGNSKRDENLKIKHDWV